MPSSWICIDANLVVRLVTDPNDTLVRPQWEQWETDGRQFTAPPLLYNEVTNAVYQYQRRGLISPESVRLALDAAQDLPIHLQGKGDLHGLALGIAQRFSLPATYDAHYLALAEQLGAEFWTADGRLIQAVQPELSWVHLLS